VASKPPRNPSDDDPSRRPAFDAKEALTVPVKPIRGSSAAKASADASAHDTLDDSADERDAPSAPSSPSSPFDDEDTGGAKNVRDARDARTELDGDITSIEQPTCLTRGLNPRAALAWVRATYGADGIATVLDALDDEDAFALGGRAGRISSRSWVPFLSHARLLGVIDSTFGAGDLKLLRSVGVYMGFHDFPLVARPFIRLSSPGFFVDKAMKLWRLYHSHGRWEIVRNADLVRAALVDHPEHHAAFCAAFVGWIEGALSLTGARDIGATETRCATRGAPFCAFEMSWGDGVRSPRDRVPKPPT